MDVALERVDTPIEETSEPSEAQSCETAKNLVLICDRLLEEGKKVVLCSSVTSGAGVDGKQELSERLNRQLQLYVEKRANAKRLRFVRLHDPRTLRSKNRAFDNFHLNSVGYRHLAASIFDEVRDMMIAIEWVYWKRRIMEATLGTAARQKEE